MTSVIHKIELQPNLVTYSLPIGSEPLAAAIQHGTIQLWFKRRSETLSMELRAFQVVGTGHIFPDPPQGKAWKFISTMLTADQDFVFHVFELVDNHG